MYAESGLMFPYYYYQSFSPDIQQFDDFGSSQKSFACLGSVVQSSSISDYDLGVEGDLFKAPVPIIEQPLVTTLDPMTVAMSMVSCGEDNIPQELSVTDIESLQNEEFLTDVFHEYKDIMAKETSPLSEVLNYKFSFKTDDDNNSIVKENGQILKSMSSGCLSSMEFSLGGQVIKPSFSTITEVDFGNVCGMRRAFSEGDIKTLGNCNAHSAGGQPQLVNEHTTTTNEDRWQKLSRYRNKKAKRNFRRKIKYACRKALADSQPRIRGRFAKTEETEIFRK